ILMVAWTLIMLEGWRPLHGEAKKNCLMFIKWEMVSHFIFCTLPEFYIDQQFLLSASIVIDSYHIVHRYLTDFEADDGTKINWFFAWKIIMYIAFLLLMLFVAMS
ncbi:hypothetical protein PFISCL1PPCAC_22992, partial [Pristionchus fissidentatus]